MQVCPEVIRFEFTPSPCSCNIRAANSAAGSRSGSSSLALKPEKKMKNQSKKYIYFLNYGKKLIVFFLWKTGFLSIVEQLATN